MSKRKKKKERKELVIYLNNNKNINFNELLNDNIGSIYIKVSLKALSNIRERLIESNYTTRLFVANIEKSDNQFYIYGKKKGGKGVFNQHCKNTVYKYQNENKLYEHLIESSSNENDMVFSDNLSVIKVALNKKRVAIHEK